MGTVLDTTVFIAFERATRGTPAEHAMQTVSMRLEEHLGPNGEVAIASITASELCTVYTEPAMSIEDDARLS